jgi:hypothetical protein
MSKRRRLAADDENKFAALLRTLRNEDEDEEFDSVDEAGGHLPIGDDAIDVDAETVIDRAALPAAPLALPTSSAIALETTPQPIAPIEIAALAIETLEAKAETLEVEAVEVEAVELKTVEIETVAVETVEIETVEIEAMVTATLEAASIEVEDLDADPDIDPDIDPDTFTAHNPTDKEDIEPHTAAEADHDTADHDTNEDSTSSTETEAPRPPGRPGRPRRKFPKPKNPNNGKRGRPATGKRSNIDWYGRTFYIRKQTDDQLEDALFQLKRSGTEIDKSDLVDALLAAWSEVTLGVISDFQIGKTVKNRLKK